MEAEQKRHPFLPKVEWGGPYPDDLGVYYSCYLRNGVYRLDVHFATRHRGNGWQLYVAHTSQLIAWNRWRGLPLESPPSELEQRKHLGYALAELQVYFLELTQELGDPQGVFEGAIRHCRQQSKAEGG